MSVLDRALANDRVLGLGLIQLLNLNSYRRIARDYPRGCLIMN
jgi:hypothetical protein